MALRASTETEIAEAVRGANGPMRIVGGGSRAIGRINTSEVLATSGLSGVRLYEPGALTLVAGAGTPLAEVEMLLANERQRLPFEVPDMRALLGLTGVSTLGGVVAANASGPRRVQVGACRDSLIGVRLVDGMGTVIKNGGRVMKNVTGYDLVKLMAGSFGTLGILTEVSFKVLPMPQTELTLKLHGLDDSRAIAAMSAALSSPYEVSGAAHWPGVGTFLRLEGFAASVAYRAGQLAAVLSDFGSATKDEDSVGRWKDIRDVAPFQNQIGDVWRLAVKPSDAPGLVARAEAMAAVYDWGGGLIWLLMAAGCDLRARLGQFTGHATRVRAGQADDIPAFQPQSQVLMSLAKGLRAKFDPRGILNPGLM